AAVQNRPPTPRSSSIRMPRPRWRVRARARVLRHLGASTAPMPGWRGAVPGMTSAIEDGIESVGAEPAGKPEEEVLETFVAGCRLRAELVHGAFGNKLAALDDPDAVAHPLGDLQGMSAHEHRPSAVHELPEEVLEQPGALGVEAYHRLVHHDHLGPVRKGAGNDQLLAHPVAVRFGQLVLPGGQLEDLQ